jgi:hypothetical protein
MLRKRSKSSDRTLEEQQKQQQANLDQGTTQAKLTERRFTQPIIKQENEREKKEIKESCLDISNCLLETDF